MFKPATPGFLITLVATVLLAIVSFSVPWIKSVFFLKAHVDFGGNQNGTATFGVLGFCLDTGGNVNCTSPKIGYEFDPNKLLGNTTPIQIPEVLVKWLTYALVLHIVALVLAAGSAVFGLLAHIREMAMTCCSSCISGFAAAVALIAFIFDVAFFFLAKARINKIPGGSAEIGNAIWLTLAAWVLLFFAGCFYTFGRCCISNRSRGPRGKPVEPSHLESSSTDTMRLEAVKAEADRKARQKMGEGGLPSFPEYDPRKPLTGKLDDEEDPYSDHPRKQAGQYSNVSAVHGPRRQASDYATAYDNPKYGGGYPPQLGPPVVDPYHASKATPQPPAQYNYTPQQSFENQYNAPGIQNNQPVSDSYFPAGGYTQYPSNISTTSAGPYGHNQYISNAQSGAGYGQDPYLSPDGQHYGHHAQDTSYYSASSHSQQASQQDTVSYAATQTASAYPAGTTAAAMSMGRDEYTFDPKGQTGSRISATSMANPYDQPSASDARLRGPRSPTTPTRSSPPSYETHGGGGVEWRSDIKR